MLAGQRRDELQACRVPGQGPLRGALSVSGPRARAGRTRARITGSVEVRALACGAASRWLFFGAASVAAAAGAAWIVWLLE
jgi:hypothetical protein